MTKSKSHVVTQISVKQNHSMDCVQYLKLIGDARAFRQAADLIEQEIVRLGIRPNNFSPIGKTTGWPEHAAWESLKTASHFNLGIALELRLKCLLQLQNNNPESTHSLAGLYGELQEVKPEIPERLEDLFQQSVTEDPFHILAYCRGLDVNNPPERPPNRPIDTLKDFFTYFDKDVELSNKRYAWESSSTHHKWHHYIDRLDAFFRLFDSSEILASESARRLGLIR